MCICGSLRRRLGLIMSAAAAIAIVALFLRALSHAPVAPSGTDELSVSPPTVPLPHQWGGAGWLAARSRPPAPAGEAVAVGANIKTDAGQRRRVLLPDGSTLYVNANSEVKLDGERHLTLLAGEVFLEVAHRENCGAGNADMSAGDRQVGNLPHSKPDGATFVVHTPQRDVSALGTRFSVRADAEGTGVVVVQGKVQVAGLATPLQAGQELAPTGTEPAPAPRVSHVLDWTRELIAAAESPLVPCSKHTGGAIVAIDPNGQEAKLSLCKYHIDVYIEDGFARTTIDQTYFNHDPWRLEGTFYFPLPPDASLSRLAMYVDGNLMEGGMAERDYARQVFESIVSRQKDPALLEWVDGSTFKMRVFPLEGRQEKRIVLSYTQRLPVLYGQTTYRFPAGHSLGIVENLSLQARIKDGANWNVFSASHPGMKSEKSGADLILRDEEHNIKLDRDIMFEFSRRETASGGRFSAVEHEGVKYLMVRYRPSLPSQQQRERRDWVFLVESSGDRDPLLARTQIEIVRSLMMQAEPDDTFAVLTAGTRVRALSAKPQAGTRENVEGAIAFLEKSHLIGALDLGRALSEAKPYLKAGTNPYLVHVGSGIAAMGERRDDVLARRIPDGTRYVGVGVGKRWGRNFMKAAAAHTGGYFTQINPDESIGWRTFELAATLNTPRLLDIKVSDSDNRAVFLTDINSLAQGEELWAIARLDGRVLPESLTVTGSLNGSPFREPLQVKDVTDHADYLPRTWAKLEIDRLLAEDAAKNKDKIVALSKAMYVMTPFTSLLVLENEEMYAQYKVDRGRKDHWAMYPCPQKIDVVYKPLPWQPVDVRSVPKDVPMTAEQVRQTIVERRPVQVLHKERGRTHYKEVFETAQVDPSASVSFVGGNAYEYFLPSRRKLSQRATGGWTYQADWDSWETSIPGLININTMWDRSKWTILSEDFQDLTNRTSPFDSLRSQTRFMTTTASMQRALEGSLRLLDNSGSMDRGIVVMTDGIDQGESLRSPAELLQALRFGKGSPFSQEQLHADELTWDRRLFEEVVRRELNGRQDRQTLYRQGLITRNYLLSIDLGRFTGGWAYPDDDPNDFAYRRPTWTSDDRIFFDLVAYCPGMYTSPADIRAVLEAEATPNPHSLPGTIDPGARRLFDKARSAGWQMMSIPGAKPQAGAGAKPQAGASAKPQAVSITFDGTGRYVYERVLPPGITERVICDGKTLLHLYPDLGIGVRRNVSRFHRMEFARVVPWGLPPVEDLRAGPISRSWTSGRLLWCRTEWSRRRMRRGRRCLMR